MYLVILFHPKYQFQLSILGSLFINYICGSNFKKLHERSSIQRSFTRGDDRRNEA